MTFNKSGENKYHSTVQHEKFGYLEWTENFSGEGIQVVSYTLVFVSEYKFLSNRKTKWISKFNIHY